MKYTSKNKLINPMIISSVSYDKFFDLTAKFSSMELGMEITSEEVKTIINFMFDDFID